MRRLGEEPYMDVERRNDILLLIASGRSKEARVNQVRAAIPAWADRPFKADQENWDANLKAYQAADPIVRKVESRLSVDPGPIWKELTAEEQTALSTWSKSIDNLYGYVNSYFPTESQKYIPQLVLAAIAIGAFVAPLFLSDDDEGLGLPFHFGPPPLPPEIGPSRRPGIPQAPSSPVQRPSFSPSSFSRITAGPRTPISVQAEVMRPAVSTPPWRSAVPASAGALPQAPGYRAFVKPLGPSMPVSAEAAKVTAAAAPAGVAPHAPHVFPRFRRQ